MPSASKSSESVKTSRSGSSAPVPANVKTFSKSSEVIESYLFASSSRNFSIYSERLLMRLVYLAQVQIAGANFRDGTDIGQVSIGPLGHATVEIPIRDLLGEGNNNYTQAKEAIKELMHSPYFIERPKKKKSGDLVYDKDGKQEFEFLGYQILNNCEVNIKPGVAVVEVNAETWRQILDFSKGFRKYALETAAQLKLVSSLRLYRLLANQKYPITYSIEQLRKMWDLDGRDPKTGKYLVYRDNSAFIKRVIDAAKDELDEKSPWTFSYHCNKSSTGRRGASSIKSITFFPIHKVFAASSSEVLKQHGLNSEVVLGRELYSVLVHKFEFSKAGIDNNLVLFSAAGKSGMDILGFLDAIAPAALRAQRPAAYVVGALKLKLKEKYGVAFQGTNILVPEGSPSGADEQ